jgi:hypothetical protein
MEANGRAVQEDEVYTVATSGGRTQYLDPQAYATQRPAVEELVRYLEQRRVIEAEPPRAFVEVT